MKQLRQLATPQTTDAPSALNRRRLMGQVVLGGAAALMLTACGGGGGGGEGNSRNLRAALDRLAAGMNTEQVIAAVGWAPNDGSTAWTTGEEWLDVTLSSNDNYTDDVIRGAIWHKGAERIQRFY